MRLLIASQSHTQEFLMRIKPRFAALFAVLFFTFLLAVGGDPAKPVSAQQAPDPVISRIIAQVSANDFLQLDKGLSGAVPIKVGGKEVTLQTRYTPSEQGTQAEQYTYEYFQQQGLTAQYESWVGDSGLCMGVRGRNVVAEMPGSKDPSRIYIFSAHLDSVSPHTDGSAAGADDDASGTAAVMLAAKILSNYRFDYTVRFVLFTGEERGLCGSASYALNARQRGDRILGVINADMIAYDSDGVKYVEIHAGTRPDSQVVANALVANIQAYGLNLLPHVLTQDATDLSDHASFWKNDYPAVAAAEEFFTGDPNPYYHSLVCCDTWDRLDTAMGADYTKAIMATISSLAGLRNLPPTPTSQPTPAPTALPIPGAGSRTFPETGKRVSGIFLDYWNDNGGLAQIGLPLSGVIGEVSPLNGKPYTVQYFERAVMEYHPENQPPYNVLLSQLGTLQYKKKYGGNAADQKTEEGAGAMLFPQTGKHIDGKFLEYWKTHGGVALLGYPISDDFIEQSPLDGKHYTVQYFERAVMEYHPENEPPNDVLLSQLGTFQYKLKYGAP